MSPLNFCTVEAFVHTSLDLYAFIAVTASLSTLDDLLEMVKSDNDRRQRILDEKGVAPSRSLDVMIALLVDVARTLTFLSPVLAPKCCQPGV